MRAWWIWLGALGLHGLFLLWYDGGSGPLAPTEVEHFMSRIASGPEEWDAERLAALRAFLGADDGREFFMVNLARLHPEPVAMPGSGEPAPAREVLERYMDHFAPALVRRAGHPVYLGRAAGGYLERWGVEADPGWSFAAVVRYRSRRDLIELATDPAFGPAHAYKIAALPNTLAFPAAPGRVVVGVRPFVALALALLAALGHLALALRRGRGSRPPAPGGGSHG